MEFGNGQTALILPGNGCVLINGRRIALMGDGDPSNTGMITLGAPTIQVEEGNPFAFLGENVQIGPNVEFNVKTQNNPPKTQQDEKYDYYLVNSVGGKEKLAVFGLWNLLENVSGIDITDYFEEERWEADPEEGGVSNAGRSTLVLIGGGLVWLDEFSKLSLRKQLISTLEKKHPQIRAMMPNQGGVLSEA